MNDEHKKKISESLRGKHKSEEHKTAYLSSKQRQKENRTTRSGYSSCTKKEKGGKTMCLNFLAAGASVLEGIGQRNAAYDQAKASLVQGQSALFEGELDSGMRHLEAANTVREAQSEADNIRRQAASMRAQAIVSQSGSGVAIGEGSAQAAIDQIQTLASADALAVLYSGANRAVSLRASGRFSAQQGRNKNLAANESASSLVAAGNMAMTQGLLKAGSQLMPGKK